MILTVIKTQFVFICDDCGARRVQDSAELPTDEPPLGHMGYRLSWRMVGRPARLCCAACVTNTTDVIHTG